MKTQPLYYFNDPRFQYSIEQLESLLSAKIIEPTTVVHTICLPFKACDVIEHIAPIVNDLLVSTIDEPDYSL